MGDMAASVTARIERLTEMGLVVFPEIDVFAEEYSGFGVQEFAKVKLDNKSFKLEEAIKTLLASDDEKHRAEGEFFQKQVDAEHPELCVPGNEEVPLVFNLWNMFPYI